MNIQKLSALLLIAAAALALVAGGARAQLVDRASEPQTSVDRSFDPSPKDCADVRWSQASLRAFPSIADACQSVEQRNGKTYVKFEGVVESVKDQGKRIRVDFEDGEDLMFAPAPRTVLYLDGKRTSFSEVQDGMKLNFYVPEDRLQAELRPDPSRVAFIIFPLDLPEVAIAEQRRPAGQSASERRQADRDRSSASARNELPATASIWPAVAFGGFAMLLLGAAMTLARRR